MATICARIEESARIEKSIFFFLFFPFFLQTERFGIECLCVKLGKCVHFDGGERDRDRERERERERDGNGGGG